MTTYKWNKRRIKRVEYPSVIRADACVVHLCTYGGQHGIYDVIAKHLRDAKQSISIVNFLITNEEVLQAIIEARRDRKLPVRIVTWLNQKEHLLIEEDSIFRLFKTQARSWRRLGLNNVPLRSNVRCHVKFMLIDDEAAIISSANLTDTSLRRNPENGILIRNMNDEIRIIHNFIKLIWGYYADHEIVAIPSYVGSNSIDDVDGGYLRVESRTASHNASGITTFPHETDNFRFLFTLPDYNSLHDYVIKLIERAEREILLVSYKIYNVKQIGLLKVLKEKIDRGVVVRILVCKKDTKILERYGKLVEIGCEVVSIVNNHAKGIVIDQKEVLIMTANIDNYLLPHKESINIGIYFKNMAYAEQAKTFINFLFDNSTHTLVRHSY